MCTWGLGPWVPRRNSGADEGGTRGGGAKNSGQTPRFVLSYGRAALGLGSGEETGHFWGLSLGQDCPLSSEASPLSHTHESIVP